MYCKPNFTYLNDLKTTRCPRSCDPFYIVSYYIKWVTTSWTYSMLYICGKYSLYSISSPLYSFPMFKAYLIYQNGHDFLDILYLEKYN